MSTTDDLRAIRKHLATGGLAGQVRRLVDVLIAERNDTDDRHPYGVCGDRAASVTGAPLVCTLDPGHEGAHFDMTSTDMWGADGGAGKGSTAAITGDRSDAQPAEAPGEDRSEIGPQKGVQSLGGDLRAMARGEHPDQSCRPHPKFTEAFLEYADRAEALEADRSTLAEVNHEAETIILVETMRAEKAEAAVARVRKVLPDLLATYWAAGAATPAVAVLEAARVLVDAALDGVDAGGEA